MESLQQQPNPSVFAQIVDSLKNKPEEELKLLYQRLFSVDLKKEWQEMSGAATFGDASEEDIIKSIQRNRYS